MGQSVFTAEYKALCRFLIQARTSAKVTQDELAKRLDKPQSYVSKYEHGERRLDVVEFLAIARALDSDPCELITQLEEIITR